MYVISKSGLTLLSLKLRISVEDQLSLLGAVLIALAITMMVGGWIGELGVHWSLSEAPVDRMAVLVWWCKPIVLWKPRLKRSEFEHRAHPACPCPGIRNLSRRTETLRTAGHDMSRLVPPCCGPWLKFRSAMTSLTGILSKLRRSIRQLRTSQYT